MKSQSRWTDGDTALAPQLLADASEDEFQAKLGRTLAAAKSRLEYLARLDTRAERPRERQIRIESQQGTKPRVTPQMLEAELRRRAAQRRSLTDLLCGAARLFGSRHQCWRKALHRLTSRRCGASSIIAIGPKSQSSGPQ
ncbi:hypothetical protein [Bradyrhizobium sp. Leo121]|uniref:hypothetical protein n=1 Tax=Bradyrhizobium sp. Leo121 TaxID=1571195 RepID=UPI00102967B5|nr:hypothetical protein [Bradyrhizobium sp. Leo121]RZN30513.1 hypothetical protein CWO90_20465 [Bradyrhizobium sp. Leo121]